MAASMFEAPGCKFGPCLNVECGHRDCELTRQMAESKCYICHKKIGYDTNFYSSAERGMSHYLCEQRVIREEHERAQKA